MITLIEFILLKTGTGDPLLDWLVNNASAIGVLSLAVVAFFRGWVVPGSTVKASEERHKQETEQLRTERDRALELVYAQAQIAARSLEVVEKVKS